MGVCANLLSIHISIPEATLSRGFMKRLQLPQLTEQRWFPPLLKQLTREFLTWFALRVRATRPFIPVILEGLEHAHYKRLNNFDLTVGAGIDAVVKFLPENILVKDVSPENFNADLPGLYTFINCFHLLPPEKARRYLGEIARAGHPVVVVEGNNDSWWQAVGMTIFVPLTVLLATPFVKPFRWTRLLFTYLLPVLPLVLVVDGVIALFKLYSPRDLDSLTASINVTNYTWASGKRDNGRGGKIIYLKGWRS